MGRKKLTIEDMHTLAAEKEGKCLSEEYIDNVSKLNWECSKGHVFSLSAARVKAGDWCKDCKKGSKENPTKNENIASDSIDKTQNEAGNINKPLESSIDSDETIVLLDKNIESKEEFVDGKSENSLTNSSEEDIKDDEKQVEIDENIEINKNENLEKIEENEDNLLASELKNQIDKLKKEKMELEEEIEYLKGRDELLNKIRRNIISQPNGDIMWKNLQQGRHDTYEY